MNIYDIAAKSGVSIATVSRVLNNADNVKAATRQRVLQVMQEEGFTPNKFARGLSLGSMRMVGILCSNIRDPFYANAVGYVEDFLRQNDLNAVLRCTGPAVEDKQKALDYLVHQKMDAIILVGSSFIEETDNSHIAQAAAQVPVIIINGYVDLPGVYCVTCDERAAIAELTGLLFRRNRQRVLLLHGPITQSCRQKIAGYTDAHKTAGMPLVESRIVESERQLEQINACVKHLLVTGVSFDAIVGTEDVLAVGAQKALQRIGLTMPVVGFNNSHLAQCSSPELTSVDNELEKLCNTALQTLVDLLDKKEVTPHITIPARLVERESFRFN